MPPPLTEKEIDQMLSTISLPTKENTHKETKEHIVVKIVIPPQENIQPYEQSQKEEKHHDSVQRKRNTPPLLTEEENNQILNM